MTATPMITLSALDDEVGKDAVLAALVPYGGNELTSCWLPGGLGFYHAGGFLRDFPPAQIEDRLVRVPVGMKLDFVAGVGDR